MQLAVRLAATLLALTWAAPVAQAATVLGSTTNSAICPRMPAEISKAIIDQAQEHKLRAIEGTSFIIKSNSIYRGNNVEQSPQ